MSQITISMPEQINEWVQTQVGTGHYADAEEYLHALVQRDRERKEQAMQELRRIIEKAEASGVSKRTLPEIRERTRQKARRMGLLPDED